jgi:hypothetical protein
MFTVPKGRPDLIMDNSPQFYSVRLKYSVWPEIYGDRRPILFPTLDAALRFAECNLSPIIHQAQVYSPDGKLVYHFSGPRE